VVVADVPGVGLMSFESWSMICVIASLLALNCLLLDFPFYVGVEGLKQTFQSHFIGLKLIIRGRPNWLSIP